MATYTGIGAAFGSWFGSGDLEDRYNQAIEELKKFNETATTSMKGFRTKGQTAFDRGIAELTSPTMAPDIAAMRKMLMTNISSGLSPYAQLALEDANRQLEQRAISTGNLRSGAVGLQRAELGRRVVADEFGRALQTVDTFQKRDLAASQMFLNTSVEYGKAENWALTTMGQTTNSIAGALVGIGSVEQQAAVAAGMAFGGLADKAEQYWGGGGMTGGGGAKDFSSTNFFTGGG
ncbi:MAG TPA: hypothetical protein VGQ08_13290 [Nitrospiraceae bacterium]|jgi:hypothetical protein|nr:hypothetical protein [Nitrospiraceae bacterium]